MDAIKIKVSRADWDAAKKVIVAEADRSERTVGQLTRDLLHKSRYSQASPKADAIASLLYQIVQTALREETQVCSESENKNRK
jgi:hypothetical protein